MEGRGEADGKLVRCIEAKGTPSVCGVPSTSRGALDEADKCADDTLEVRVQRRVQPRHEPERFRDLEAREHLARRTERHVILRGAVAPAAVHAFGQVEYDARRRPAQLAPEVPILAFDEDDGRPQPPDELENEGVDVQHGLAPFANHPPRARESQSLSGAPQAPREARAKPLGASSMDARTKGEEMFNTS